MTDPACEHFGEISAELALGVLPGRERAEALAHVGRCASCLQDLASLGDVADRLVELIPAAEPPVGFEMRVLQRLTPSLVPGPRPVVPILLRLTAAAALAVAVGIGGWAVGHHDARPVPTAVGYEGGPLLTASFVAGGRPAGHVVTFGGRHPWMAVDIDSDLGDRIIRCMVDERNGTTIRLGTFRLAGGHGYWSAPIGVTPAAVSSVRLLDALGADVATATFGLAT